MSFLITLIVSEIGRSLHFTLLLFMNNDYLKPPRPLWKWVKGTRKWEGMVLMAHSLYVNWNEYEFLKCCSISLRMFIVYCKPFSFFHNFESLCMESRWNLDIFKIRVIQYWLVTNCYDSCKEFVLVPVNLFLRSKLLYKTLCTSDLNLCKFKMEQSTLFSYLG